MYFLAKNRGFIFVFFGLFFTLTVVYFTQQKVGENRSVTTIAKLPKLSSAQETVSFNSTLVENKIVFPCEIQDYVIEDVFLNSDWKIKASFSCIHLNKEGKTEQYFVPLIIENEIATNIFGKGYFPQGHFEKVAIETLVNQIEVNNQDRFAILSLIVDHNVPPSEFDLLQPDFTFMYELSKNYGKDAKKLVNSGDIKSVSIDKKYVLPVSVYFVKK